MKIAQKQLEKAQSFDCAAYRQKLLDKAQKRLERLQEIEIKLNGN